jgi:hypothetical protein
LSALLKEWEGFVRREAAFIVRKEYGPTVKEVDEAVTGRVEEWEMMRQTIDTVGDTPARPTVDTAVSPALKVGLDDEGEGADDRPGPGAVVGVMSCLPLKVDEGVHVVRLVTAKVGSELKADAVGGEVTQHEELVRVAVKGAKEVDGVVQSDRTQNART